MRGRVPESTDFGEWLHAIIGLKKEAAEHGDGVATAVDAAIREARDFGTSLVGDITNTLMTSRSLRDHGMPGVVFFELLGFRTEDAAALMQAAIERLNGEPPSELLRHTLAPHSPYSVSPALFGLIRHALQRDPFARSSIHLGESEAEVEFLKHGTGPCRAALAELGKWDASWVAPHCDPVEYLDRMGFIDDHILIVHG